MLPAGVAPSPGSGSAAVDVNEAGGRIEADTARFQIEGGLPHGFQSDPRDTEVDGLPGQVEAVGGHAPPFAEKQVVVCARAEAGDDVDPVSPAEAIVHRIQVFDYPDVDPGHLLGVMTAEEAIHGNQRFGIVAAPAVPVSDLQLFRGVDIEKGESPLGDTSDRPPVLRKRLPGTKAERAGEGGLEKRPSTNDTGKHIVPRCRDGQYYIRFRFRFVSS